MATTIATVVDMGADLLDLIPGAWERSIYYDVSKLSEECGEVAEALNKSAKTVEDLAEELADVILVCSVIALKQGIDLNKAILSKHPKRISKLLKRWHGGVYPKGTTPRVAQT